MPSKQDLHFASAPSDLSKTTQDFLARDVDDLVAEIKENLRLRSKPVHSTCKQRATPYRVPSRIQDLKCHSCGSPRSRTNTKRSDTSDPYELLQMLLQKGSLIKEAVKRLQNTGDEERKENTTKLFYEDVESHTPILHLDL